MVRLELFGKKNDDVATPVDLFAQLFFEFGFDFDPCPLNSDVDGLCVEWGERNYVNPPYSQIRKWIEKGIQEKRKGKLSVFLITARTQSKYWHELIFPEASEIRFIRKGVAFQGHENKLPIPLAIVIFDPDKKRKRITELGYPYEMYPIVLK